MSSYQKYTLNTVTRIILISNFRFDGRKI